MTKFSITTLEQARKDAQGFANQLLKGEKSIATYGYPKSLRWLNAVAAFHSSGKIADAILSIENGFASRKPTKKNQKELETFFGALENYETYIKHSEFHLIKSREPIDLHLNKKLGIGGQIPLIFMKPEEGYAAYFISKENLFWQNELKYPVLQDYLGKVVFNTDPQLIEMGYVDFFTGEFHGNIFSRQQLREAVKELDSIGRDISQYL